jgi:hypothetical protein
MPDRRRGFRLCFVAACLLLVTYETWAFFVGETPALTIQGYHLKSADDFGQGAGVSQLFAMNGDGLSAMAVQFSTDRPLTLLLRCELAEIAPPGSPGESPYAFGSTSLFVTIKNVSGVEWRRIRFPTVEASNKRWYVLRLALVKAVPADAIADTTPATPDPLPRVGLMVSRENVFGGGALWISDRRQLGSLSIRAFTQRRTAYARFRADLTPVLPPLLRNAGIQLALFVGYQAALLIVVYVLLAGVVISSSVPAAAGSTGRAPTP